MNYTSPKIKSKLAREELKKEDDKKEKELISSLTQDEFHEVRFQNEYPYVIMDVVNLLCGYEFLKPSTISEEEEYADQQRPNTTNYEQECNNLKI